jgi:hypothetical protein
MFLPAIENIAVKATPFLQNLVEVSKKSKVIPR